jgi:alkaline phosphatase
MLLVFSAAPVFCEAQERPVKYVFLLIGDGMGTAQRRLPELATGQKLLLNQLPVTAATQTASADQPITDSAAAGTALATGIRTNNAMIGLDPEGKRLETIAEYAKKQGYRVGILSSATINHATPAAFYAHVPNRGQYDEIAADLPRSGFDFFGGNGLSANKDSKPAYDLVRESGYAVEKAQTLLELNGIGIEGRTYIYRSFGETLFDQEKNVFTLADITAKAIAALASPEGFFIMVEAAQIDWRCHTNCPAGAIAEVLDFNEVVKVAYAFYEAHPDETLIIVTADHETGGLSIAEPEKLTGLREENPALLNRFLSREASYGGLTRVARMLRDGKASFEDAQAAMRKQAGLDELTEDEVQILRQAWGKEELQEEDAMMLYAQHEPLAVAAQRIVSARMGLGWSTFGHSATDITTTAVGVGAESFSGSYHLTHIPQTLFRMMNRGR